MTRFPYVKRLAILLALASVYFAAGKLGLRLAFVHASATAVWPPTGIALAAFLVLGRRVWPAVLVGAFLVNVTTTPAILTSLGIATGNTLEGLLGAYLVERFARGARAFERAPDVFRFALLAAVLSTTVSATFGVTSLSVTGFARWADYGPIWLTWWLGDAGGDLVVAPLLLLWIENPRLRWDPRRALEAAALFAAALFVGEMVFGGLLPSGARNYPLEIMCMPLFIWAGFRFGQREGALAVALVYAVAVQGTLSGLGPFGRQSHNESLLLLQGFTSIASVTTLTLAAVVSQHKSGEERLRQLAVSDALTGLGNYRRLIAVLEQEIQRSQRTGRRFAILFLDLDDLKKINDRHGHLVGSRALWRVAEVLRRTSRAIDTAARYGGGRVRARAPGDRQERGRAGGAPRKRADIVRRRAASGHRQHRRGGLRAGRHDRGRAGGRGRPRAVRLEGARALAPVEPRKQSSIWRWTE